MKVATVNHAAFDVNQTDVTLRKGILFEFCTESGSFLLAVIQKADEGRNWIAADQVSFNFLIEKGFYYSSYAVFKESLLIVHDVIKQVKGSFHVV